VSVPWLLVSILVFEAAQRILEWYESQDPPETGDRWRARKAISRALDPDDPAIQHPQDVTGFKHEPTPQEDLF
jgi:hypothetical protein